MADNKPINWAYPFKTAGEDSKEVNDPQLFLDALAKAKDGFYPMGANGLWHGGVHFDAGSATLLDQSAIRCIADGEVIAYRINDKYPETPYTVMGSEPVAAKYSTGFVLVRHRLELPPLPAPSTPAGETSDTTTAATHTDPSTPATAGADTASASEGLTFYSLYMHLLDWAGYESADVPEPAEFLAPICYAVKSTADDPLMGLRVRALSEDGTNEVLALLPKGCKVTVGEAHSIKSQYKKLLSIDEGAAIPALPAGAVGWVYGPELTDNAVADKATDTEVELTRSHQGLNVRKEGKLTGTIIGVLPRGATLKVGEKQRGGYSKVLEVMDYRGVPALPDGPDGKPLGYVYFEALETQKTEPSALNSIHILPKPYRIKAGELVGHIGKYQNHNEGTAKKRLHLEVFTSEDVPTFIEKSRAIGEKLPDEQKTLIKVDKGSKIVQPAAADAQVEAGVDVRLCSDSPKAGCWAKVQKYAICNADKNSELGSYNSTKLTYPLSAAQKTLLASRMGVDAADMPDQVDFLKVYFNSLEGGDPHDYEPNKNIPTTHPWRKIGAVVGKPFWVKRSTLNAQGQRSSTAGSLDAWSDFPLHSGLEGKASDYVRILPASSWDTLPDERKAIDVEQVRWWYVTVGDVEGNDISGWAPEKDLIVTRHSPWEWPGFSTLQDKLSLDAYLARTLDATGRAMEEETESYAALIEEAERGPILSKLYEIIDQPDEKGVRDNKLTPEEFQAALGKPWLAQQLSLLISQHESEWFWSESKWNQLDKLMEHTPEDPNPQWVKEKERIKTLSWWKELAGQPGIAADGMAWHFQSAWLIANFIKGRVRRRRDYDLGALSSAYETGGRGSRTVSGGVGDAGGVSYGAYQMTSQVTLSNGDVIIGGTVKKFINWSEFLWADEFAGLVPGSVSFTQKWKDLVDEHAEKFTEIEHEFIKVTHYDIQIQKIISNTGVDLRYHSHTMNDVVWSTAVQQGPGASIIVNAINSISITHEETKAYDSALINAIYSERGRRIVGGEKDGQLFYFSKNSINTQEGVAARFVSEKTEAQELLKNENDY